MSTVSWEKILILVMITFGLFEAIAVRDEGILLDFIVGALKGAVWVAISGAIIWVLTYVITF